MPSGSVPVNFASADGSGSLAYPLRCFAGSCSRPPPGTATTETFNYTGAAQTWTVPAGVTTATFDVYGAEGGATRSGLQEVWVARAVTSRRRWI